MPSGNLREYIRKRPGADRLELVGAPAAASDDVFTPHKAARYR